jgi:hypothetical protein
VRDVAAACLSRPAADSIAPLPNTQENCLAGWMDARRERHFLQSRRISAQLRCAIVPCIAAEAGIFVKTAFPK